MKLLIPLEKFNKLNLFKALALSIAFAIITAYFVKWVPESFIHTPPYEALKKFSNISLWLALLFILIEALINKLFKVTSLYWIKKFEYFLILFWLSTQQILETPVFRATHDYPGDNVLAIIAFFIIFLASLICYPLNMTKTHVQSKNI